jgi:hypothetical protein
LLVLSVLVCMLSPLPGGCGISMTVRRGNHPQQPAHRAFLFSTSRATLNY